MNAFQLDCGRMFFSLEQILSFAQTMAENGLDTLILAFGNEGCRFLLDDMNIKTAAAQYASEQVKSAVCKGNRIYRDCGTNELTQKEMEEIIRFCKERHIQVIPLLNTPGHMSALLTAMEELGIKTVRYENSRTTIDLSNQEATDFLFAFLEKYIAWFAEKGSGYFHLGCDEYANDVLHNGFKSLQNNNNYSLFVNYVNALADKVLKEGLVPVMFNDGMYYGNAGKEDLLNPKIICAYWSKGWIGYELALAQKVAEHGHKILNTNNGWYYVLARHDGLPCNQDFTIEKALLGAKNIGAEEVAGSGKMETCGKVVCLWCDEPALLTDEEKECVKNLIMSHKVNTMAFTK